MDKKTLNSVQQFDRENNMKKIIMLLTGLILCGCTTLSKDVKLVTNNATNPASLLIYRESAFQASAVSLYIGRNDQYFIKLRNNQYSEVEIDAGKYLLQAKADASPASELEIELKPDKKTCLASKPNPGMLGALLIPLVANMVPTFLLEQVDCPNIEQLSKYNAVKKPNEI